MAWIVHVGGLGKTGATAVLSALLDTGRFLSLKGKTTSVSESRVFGGRRPLVSQIATLTDLTAHDVLGLWTAGARVDDVSLLSPGARDLLRRAGDAHGINHKVFRTVEAGELLEAAQATALRLRAAPDVPARRLAYLQGTYAAIRALLGQDGRHVLVDNDPGAASDIAEHLRADDRVAFVAVIRDPGDQYVDRRTIKESHDTAPVNTLRTVRAAVLRRRELSALARFAELRLDRFFVVHFDRFVTDAGYRTFFLGRLLGTPLPPPTKNPRFRAEQAAAKVGQAAATGDALQHLIFSRACANGYAQASGFAVPSVWPTLGIDCPD